MALTKSLLITSLFRYFRIFMPKLKAPGVKLGYYSDGCALFWKTSTFELVSGKRLTFKLGNQVIIVAKLRHMPSGVVIVVVVTHLKAQKSETNEKIRRMQAEEVLGSVQEAVRQQALKQGSDDVPVLIMGDLNADPPSEIPFADSSVQRILSNHCLPGDQEEKPIKFCSAYPVDPPQASFFTTWKTRGTDTVKRIIDYIFYSDNLRCTEWLEVPAEDELKEAHSPNHAPLPGLRYPSDHLMIAAKFDFFDSTTSQR